MCYDYFAVANPNAIALGVFALDRRFYCGGLLFDACKTSFFYAGGTPAPRRVGFS